MILIADCGSTKCDWILVKNPNESQHLETPGFNPFHHKEEEIRSFICSNAALTEVGTFVKKVFFYGAGCSGEKLNAIVINALKSVFGSAEIHVEHDMLGAALSTWNGHPAITGIMGTGSNSCFYDGKIVMQANDGLGLGYILGDEGSGSYYGKKILRMYLQQTLPFDIHSFLKEKYQLTREKIVDSVYRKPNANVFLASFSDVLSVFRKDPWVQEMLQEGMNQFLESHVICYPQSKEVPLHMIGSIAYHFKEELEEAAKKKQIVIGNIIQKPITGLLKYHLTYHQEGF